METYISGIRKQREAMSLRFRIGVSVSFSIPASIASPPEASSAPPDDFCAAPYPAASTASITFAAGTSPSTPMEFVRRLTEQDVTPSSFETAFSTRALHAAQLMPVTVYCSIEYPSYLADITSKIPYRGIISSSSVMLPLTHLPSHPSHYGYPRLHRCGYGS